MSKLLDQLEAMDAKAKAAGHSLVDVINHAAKSAFGTDIKPAFEAVKAEAEAAVEKVEEL